MKKRLISTLLALCITLSLLPVQALATNSPSSGTCGDNLVWTLDEEGTLTISGTGSMENYLGYHSDIHSPWNDMRASIKTLEIASGVTSIGNYAFWMCNMLTSVSIPETVTSIGNGAFESTDLTNVSLPDTVSSIGDDAFSDCKRLTSITIPDSVTSIGQGAFSGCSSLTDIIIPDSVASIGQGAFSGCSLTDIIIPDSVISIGQGAFSGCSSLTSVHLPNKITCMEDFMFSGCSKLTNITIPNSVTSIGFQVFENCSSLTSIVIPDGVTNITAGTFWNCSSLTSITLPRSLLTIDGTFAFANCSSLTSITIPEGVTWIADRAFIYCGKLDKVVIPGSVATMGCEVFNECHELKTAGPIGSGCNYELGWTDKIPDHAFDACRDLTSIIIPDSITSIGSLAFIGCTNLTSITIPSSVSNIDRAAFSDCTSLTDVYYSGTKAQWDEISIEELNDPLINATIHFGEDVPVESKITALYPANGSTFDFANTSADTRPRIFFDREVADVHGGRAGLDFSNGTLQIHRASDDAVVYEVKESSFGTGYSEQVSLWGDSALAPKAVRLIDATPKLDYDTEYYVTMPAGFIKMADGTGSPAIDKGNWCFKTGFFWKNGKFKFSSDITKNNNSYDYSYSDEYFSQVSTEYNHNLATMSLSLAMSAFNSYETKASGYAEEVASQNVSRLLGDLQFKSIRTDSYEGRPYTHSIAAAFGKKTFVANENEYTLIAAAIRGGGYEAEWGGNFEVGQNGNHSGFQKAANKVLNELKQYINDEQIRGKVKLWITGYSRSAATANLLAAAIDDKALFRGEHAVDDTMVTLELSDVYAYTFEAPMPTTNDTSPERYGNIHNIVNPIDLVPKVAPKGWSFCRYGISYYIPSAETTANYSDFIQRVCLKYGEIISEAANSPIQPIKHFQNQSEFLDAFLDWLSEEELPRKKFSPQYENVLVPLVSEFLGAEGSQYGENIFYALIEFCIRYPADAVRIIDKLKNILGNKIFWIVVSEQAIEQGMDALGWTDTTATDILGMLGDILFQSHYPEVTLAWMHTINRVDEYRGSKYRRLFIDCPVNVSVYDANNQLVAQIIGDEAQLLNNSTIGAYVDGNNRKIVILPVDETYRTVIDATGNGTVTYTVEEYDLSDSSVDRLVSYQEVEITEEDCLSGVIENLDEVTAANYPLYKGETTNPIVPTINQGAGVSQPSQPSIIPPAYLPPISGSNNYSITISTGLGGAITTSPTSASKGTTVTLSITPDEGYALSSITVTDNKGSKLELTDKGNSKYTFIMPASAVTVNAVFEKIEPAESTPVDEAYLFPFTDVLKTDWFCGAVEYVFNNELMSGTAPYTFDPQGKMNRAMVWTVLGRMADADVDGSGSPWYSKAQTWATSSNMSDGTNPTNSISRQELMTMLWRYMGSPAATADLSKFSDCESVADWANAAMQWAVSTELIVGDNGRLNPTGDARRCEVATIFMRFCESIAE